MQIHYMDMKVIVTLEIHFLHLNPMASYISIMLEVINLVIETKDGVTS